jgi:uncharacterized protein UPF0236
MRDDTTRAQIVAAVQQEIEQLVADLLLTAQLDLATAESLTRERLRAVGARLLEESLAARGTGKTGGREPCACGGTATFEGYRSKDVQTVVGWIRLRRAYYHCRGCGQSAIPLDSRLGLSRDSHSPGVRRLASQLGALLPFAQAAGTLADTTGIRLSPSTIRVVSEAVGARREAELRQQVARAWQDGVPAVVGPAPERLYVAMDGVRILATDGSRTEAKVGVVVPEARLPDGRERRDMARYVVSFDEATAFGQRLALEAQRRGVETAATVIVLGDGAAWIWNLAAEHFPTATCIVDWYHASERIWELGRALYGEGTSKTARWVARQLTHLAAGRVRRLVTAWQRLVCSGMTAQVRDEQVTYFTNQASRMAYDQYRARGLDIGSGMVESACKALIAMREKGPGMRWQPAGAQAVANIRVLLFNDEWDDYAIPLAPAA